MTNLLFILTALLLVGMNAFFVAAEFGLVKLRHSRIEIIEENYGMRGRILSIIHNNLDVYLSACQLGITLASLGLGWVGEPAFARLLEQVFVWLHIRSPEVIRIISFFTAFGFISFLHIVAGELMPKSLAIRRPEKIAIWSAIPLYIFYWIMCPIIWSLNACAMMTLKWFGFDKTQKDEHSYSSNEIKFILSASHTHGELTKDETEILEHTLDLADLTVTDVMRPQDEMVLIDIGEPLDAINHLVAETRYSRYPVYYQNKRDIIGVLHIKDLFVALSRHKTLEDVKSLVRPIIKVSTEVNALDLLRRFRSGVSHFALIYHNDNLLGFVTLDNLLHVLIGRVQDEFHKTQDDWVVNADGTLLVKGSCPLASLERALDIDIDLEEEEQAETLYGLIFNHLGHLPAEGEQIQFKEFTAVVLKMRGARILSVKIIPASQASS